jgi:hypothetical protein
MLGSNFQNAYIIYIYKGVASLSGVSLLSLCILLPSLLTSHQLCDKYHTNSKQKSERRKLSFNDTYYFFYIIEFITSNYYIKNCGHLHFEKKKFLKRMGWRGRHRTSLASGPYPEVTNSAQISCMNATAKASKFRRSKIVDFSACITPFSSALPSAPISFPTDATRVSRTSGGTL